MCQKLYPVLINMGGWALTSDKSLPTPPQQPSHSCGEEVLVLLNKGIRCFGAGGVPPKHPPLMLRTCGLVCFMRGVGALAHLPLPGLLTCMLR